jgi:hypothetical protein
MAILLFLLAGMKANGYNDQLAAAENCAGFQILWVPAIVIASQVPSLYCFSELRRRYNASPHAYQLLVATV